MSLSFGPGGGGARRQFSRVIKPPTYLHDYQLSAEDRQSLGMSGGPDNTSDEKKALEEFLSFLRVSRNENCFLVGTSEDVVALLLKKLKKVDPADEFQKVLKGFSHWERIQFKLGIERRKRMELKVYFMSNISKSEETVATMLEKSVLNITKAEKDSYLQRHCKDIKMIKETKESKKNFDDPEMEIEINSIGEPIKIRASKKATARESPKDVEENIDIQNNVLLAEAPKKLSFKDIDNLSSYAPPVPVQRRDLHYVKAVEQEKILDNTKMFSEVSPTAPVPELSVTASECASQPLLSLRPPPSSLPASAASVRAKMTARDVSERIKRSKEVPAASSAFRFGLAAPSSTQTSGLVERTDCEIAGPGVSSTSGERTEVNLQIRPKIVDRKDKIRCVLCSPLYKDVDVFMKMTDIRKHYENHHKLSQEFIKVGSNHFTEVHISKFVPSKKGFSGCRVCGQQPNRVLNGMSAGDYKHFLDNHKLNKTFMESIEKLILGEKLPEVIKKWIKPVKPQKSEMIKRAITSVITSPASTVQTKLSFKSLKYLLRPEVYAERMKTSSTTAAQAGYVSLVTGPRQPPMTSLIPGLAPAASSVVRNNNLQTAPLQTAPLQTAPLQPVNVQSSDARCLQIVEFLRSYLLSNVTPQPGHMVMCPQLYKDYKLFTRERQGHLIVHPDR